ncbi:MAG: hypothetical protein R2713_22035 [Ilumatobacteraceae bacterium]
MEAGAGTDTAGAATAGAAPPDAAGITGRGATSGGPAARRGTATPGAATGGRRRRLLRGGRSGEPGLSLGGCCGSPALLLLDDGSAEVGFRLTVLLLQLDGERLALDALLFERGEQGGLFVLLRVERGAVLGELFDELVELVGGTGALVERHARELAAFEVVGELRRRREQRRQTARSTGGEAVDGDLCHLRLQDPEGRGLGVDARLRLLDLDRELVEPVEGGGVILLELAEPVVEGLQLVGDLLDPATLVVGAVTVDDGCAQRRHEHQGRCRRRHSTNSRATPHDGEQCRRVTKWCRMRRTRDK